MKREKDNEKENIVTVYRIYDQGKDFLVRVCIRVYFNCFKTSH